MKQKIIDFFETELGKRAGTYGLWILVVIVTISTYIITDNHHKNGKKDVEASMIVDETKSYVETSKPKETTIAETEKITTTETTTLLVEVETTEETTTFPVVIPMENLNVSKGDDIGEDAAPQKKPNVVVEKEPETTTMQKIEDEEPEEIVRPLDNHIFSAPQPSANEYACMVHGIDVSKWNGDINWKKVKAAGYNFAIIRCGYRGYETGALATDDRFEDNIKGAKAAGVQVGVYFFSQAISEKEAQEEASLVINMLKDYNITYPVVFDWETAPGYRTYSGISNEKMTKIVNTFLTMIENAGYEAMVYGNKYDLQRFDYVSVSKSYKIWHARYPAKYEDTQAYYKAGEEMPELDCAYQMWQYKSTGKVDGIQGDVDMNVAFFSYEGSGVANTTLDIKVAKDPVVTNIGVPIEDLYNGVTATNLAGIDATKTVTYIIYDENGNVVDENTIYDVAGTYELAYYIKDFTGIPFRKNVKLIVRDNPQLTLKYECIGWFDSTDAEGILKETIVSSFKERLENIIRDNIAISMDYDGVDLHEQVIINEYSKEEAVGMDGYEVCYKVTDNTGLTTEAIMTVSKVELLSDRVEVKLSELDSEDVLDAIKEQMLKNLSIEGVQGIEVVLDDALIKAYESGVIEAGSEYEIRYIMTDMDALSFYKSCIIILPEGMSEIISESTSNDASNATSDVTTENNEETTGENGSENETSGQIGD